MSLFTSLAFAVAMFLAFMERQFRYNRSLGALQHRVTAVVARNEADPGTPVAPGTAQEQPLDRHRVVGPSPGSRPERAHESGCSSPCVKSPPVQPNISS